MNNYRKYSTQKVILAISLVLLAVTIGLNLFVKTGPEPDVVCSMPNRNIEWTGAGYNGIWGR